VPVGGRSVVQLSPAGRSESETGCDLRNGKCDLTALALTVGEAGDRIAAGTRVGYAEVTWAIVKLWQRD
jgi:hypothetical protein